MKKFEEGIKAFEEERYDDAIKYLSTVDNDGDMDNDTLYKVYMCIGESYDKISDYIKALEYLRKSADLANSMKNRNMEFCALYRMIAVYCAIKDYDTAQKINDRILVLAKKENDPVMLGRAYNSLGVICNASPNITEQDRMNGISLLKKGLESVKGKGISEVECALHINIGCTYTDLLLCDLALEHLFKAKDIIKDCKESFLNSTADLNIAEAYFENGEFDKALKYLNCATAVLEEKKYKNNLTEAYELYCKIYEKKKEYKKALDYSKRYIELMLDIKNTDYINTVSNLQMKYEVLKLEKDKEIYRIKNEELKQLNEELKAAYNVVNTLSETDFLTSFFNRRGMEYGIESLDKNKEHGMLLIDIDYFKRINDNFGHHVGDEVLRSTADLIRSYVDREKCMLIRLGGEEFIIILKNSSKEEAYELGKEILQLIRNNEFYVDKEKIKITVTIGVDGFTGGKKEFNESVKRADIKLYDGKKHGRDIIII